jgi:uncharacterized protein (TIGR02246 family)
MSAAENKKLVQDIYAALANGDRTLFRNAMADDFRWIIAGESVWSGSFDGREAVANDLLRPLFAQFAGEYRNRAVRFIAEDDYVVVECRGEVTTKRGEPYNNQYCMIFRLADGKLKEVTEYMDTDLCVKRLDPPPALLG